MKKAVIFDFDGVLVESAQIKTEAFRRLFSQWSDKVDEITAYHLKNMGISRHVKFRHFYENILRIPYSDEIGESLGKRFSDIVVEEIVKAPLVNGAKEFLSENKEDYLFFIASGTPQDELAAIVSAKGLNQYFSGIFGAPATKTQIVTTIMNAYSLQKDQTVFVGDAESDKKAAQETGICFILRITDENRDIIENALYSIADLTQLGRVLKEVIR